MTNASEDEDDLAIRPPSKPSEMRKMSDDELATFARKLAFGGRFPFDRMVEHELNVRLIGAMKDFKRAADRSSRTLSMLTAVLVLLTIVLVIYTIRAG
jgi:hypothetical protein